VSRTAPPFTHAGAADPTAGVRSGDARLVLLWGAAFFLATPDWVPINAGMGIQLSMLCALLLLASAVLDDARVPVTPGATALGVLLAALAASVFPLVLHGGGLEVAAPRVAKWATQTSQFVLMACCALGVWMHTHRAPANARWVHGGLVTAAVLTITSGALFMALDRAGIRVELPHNNQSFTQGLEWVAAVTTREGIGPPRLYGLFKEPGFLSMFVAPLAVYFVILGIRRWRERRAAYLLLAAGAAAILYATGGRTGQIAFLLTVPLLVLALKGWIRLSQLYLALAMLAVPVGFLVGTVVAPGLLEGADFSVVQRSAAAVLGFRMFVAHPVFGVGYGNFGHAYPEFLEEFASDPALYAVLADQYVNGAGLPPAYNIAVRFLAEVGLLGFAALVGLGCVVLSRAIRARCAPALGAALGLCCFLIGGIDSFAMFQFWILLVLAQPEVYQSPHARGAAGE
jgi:hypothetical protein